MGVFQKIQEKINKEKQAIEIASVERRKKRLETIKKKIEIEKENQEIRHYENKLKEIKNIGKKKINIKGLFDKVLPKPQSQRKKADDWYLPDKKESSPCIPLKEKRIIVKCDNCGGEEHEASAIGKKCFFCMRGTMIKQ